MNERIEYKLIKEKEKNERKRKRRLGLNISGIKKADISFLKYQLEISSLTKKERQKVFCIAKIQNNKKKEEKSEIDDN